MVIMTLLSGIVIRLIELFDFKSQHKLLQQIEKEKNRCKMIIRATVIAFHFHGYDDIVIRHGYQAYSISLLESQTRSSRSSRSGQIEGN